MNPVVQLPLTVFYDASCPMCASEMHTLKARDTGDRLALVDCSAPEFRHEDAEREGITVAAMMTRIHARGADGRWLVGVDCFATVYGIAGLEWVARLLGTPVIRPILEAVYPWIARHRQVLSRMGANAIVRLFMSVACVKSNCPGGPDYLQSLRHDVTP